MGQIATVAVILSVLMLAGCFHHTVTMEPIEVKPIHITVDVLVKVDKELDDFFDYQEAGDSDGAGKGEQP
jgi:hypothetical protein